MNKISSKVIIVTSQKDIAGMNMQQHLLENYNFIEEQNFEIPNQWPEGEYKLFRNEKALILNIDEAQIHTNYLKGTLDTSLIIFASKHYAKSGKKALLVHTTGVWLEDEGFGGNDHQLAIAPANVLTYAYDQIKKQKVGLDEYWIGIEATHHGPTDLDIPILFAETGGTEVEWNDKKACALIADVIMSIIDLIHSGNTDNERITLIGIGGGHYCPSFIRKLDTNEYTFGHIAPKFVLDNITKDLLIQAWEKTISSSKIFMIDKKGCRASQRKQVIELLESLNYPWQYA